MEVLNSSNFEVKAPSEWVLFTPDSTPLEMYEIKENTANQIEMNTPLKCNFEVANFCPKNAENVCFCSEIDDEIAKGDLKSTPDRPKAFSCQRRRKVSYFCSESPKGILRSVPMEFGIPDFCNQRTLPETFELDEPQKSITEIWSNISLSNSKNMESVESENSDISSNEIDLI